jgi:hypothetical protein
VMRLVSILVCDLLVAAALLVALRRTSSRWQVLGLALVCVPTLVYSTVIAAPNAVGFSGAILLWNALLALPDSGPSLSLRPVVGAVVGISAVATTHSTGFVWVGAIAICGAPLWAPRARALVEHHARSAMLALGMAGTVVALALGWVVVNGTNDPRSEAGDFGNAPAKLLFVMPVIWVLQSIATLRFRDQPAPMIVYAVGVATLATLFVVGWRRLPARAQLAIGLTASASLIVPLVATFIGYPHVGNAWQARYGLPLYIGVYLMTLQAARPGNRTSRLACGGITLVVGLLQVATLWAMIDYEASIGVWDEGATTSRHGWVLALAAASACLMYASSRAVDEGLAVA